jgi:hypothetical protein
MSWLNSRSTIKTLISLLVGAGRAWFVMRTQAFKTSAASCRRCLKPLLKNTLYLSGNYHGHHFVYQATSAPPLCLSPRLPKNKDPYLCSATFFGPPLLQKSATPKKTIYKNHDCCIFRAPVTDFLHGAIPVIDPVIDPVVDGR